MTPREIIEKARRPAVGCCNVYLNEETLAALLAELLARHERRTTELLAANNGLVEARRAATRRAVRAEDWETALRSLLRRAHVELAQHRQALEALGHPLPDTAIGAEIALLLEQTGVAAS